MQLLNTGPARPMPPNPSPDADSVLTLRDWLTLILVVLACTLGIVLVVPNWLDSLHATVSGEKPKVFWYLGRSSALVSYGWLWLSMLIGLLMTNKRARLWRGGPSTLSLHQYASLLGLLFGVFHAFVLMGSRYLHYSVLDVLIPMHSNVHQPLWVAFGQVSLYLMAVVAFSFYVKRFIGQRLWRLLHYLSFGVFVAVILHGVRTGTDTGHPVVQVVYIVSAVSVLGLLLYRVIHGIRLPRLGRAARPLPEPLPEPMTVAQPAAPSRSTKRALAKAPSAPTPALAIAVVYGSQTGNAQALARRTFESLNHAQLPAALLDGNHIKPSDLHSTTHLLVVCSTTGEGEPPDNIRRLFDQLQSPQAPSLAHLSFSVLALGDRTYAHFCAAGIALDGRLQALGAQRLCPLVMCDVSHEQEFASWSAQILKQLTQAARATQPKELRAKTTRTLAPSTPTAKPATTNRAPRTVTSARKRKPQPILLTTQTPDAARAKPAFEETKFFLMPAEAPQRTHGTTEVFAAQVLRNVNLTADLHDDNCRQIRHVVFSLLGSALSYEPGDALGVFPENDPALVDRVLALTQFSADATVPLPDGGEAPLQEALVRHYDISKLTTRHIQAVAERTNSAPLQRWLKPEHAQTRAGMVEGRQLEDLLNMHPGAFADARDFVSVLDALRPRWYSIASSQKMYPSQVHLTVGVAEYKTADGRMRLGVCSGDLARASMQTHRAIFVKRQPAFHLPSDPATPVIMVGPGTGIAPFRAFLQERIVTAATGKNWLIFGCRNAHSDFLYQDELHQMQTSGVLSRLDVAFSRDGLRKHYVQDVMRAKAAKMWQWFEAGAHFYVCGDAKHMAKDVDVALHDVAMVGGGLSPDDAVAWVADLRQQGRYQRDVYLP